MAGRGDKPMVAANYKRKPKLLAAEEIASMLLAKMKRDAEAYLGAPVTSAVVTVPVSFDILQRRATKDALAIAGLDVLGVVHEPVATAVAYDLHETESTETKNVLVFDLGGGTTSVVLLTIAADKITFRATAGDPHLGGEDFDSRLVEHLIEQFKTECKKDVSGSARALARLRVAC
jgi:L1 cell adhesion molecule like protein